MPSPAITTAGRYGRRHALHLIGLLGVAFPLCANGQVSVTITVQANANLRTGPSTNRKVIRVLQAGDTATLLSVHTRNDYLNVASNADTGWVFSALVELVEAASVAVVPNPTVTPPPVTPPSVTPSPGVSTGVSVAPSSYHSCPLPGNPSPSGPNVAALTTLNQKKNRFHAPADADIDPRFTLDAALQPGVDDTRFDDTKGGELEGFVVNVKVGGVETVNCKATDPLYRDTHIEVATRPDAPERERVIVEVTPRWRAAMQAAHADWTTQGLQSLIGKRVRFRGWVLFDTEHRGQAANTAPNNTKDWRATVWELHPVTAFTVTGP